LLKKVFLIIIIFLIYPLNLSANEKNLIIAQLLEVNNFNFDFEQASNEKKETGNCILVFDSQLKCNYNDDKQKEIIINNQTLVVLHKRYDKKYFYPIKNSPFSKILNKKELIQLISEADIIIGENIGLTYENESKVLVFFDKKSYDFKGWSIIDNFNNEILFSINIKSINGNYDPGIFKIPSIN
jgi:outer membrane lipoprotein-sorting protein